MAYTYLSVNQLTFIHHCLENLDFLIRPKYLGPLVVILKGSSFLFKSLSWIYVDLHLMRSACFAQRNRGRRYPSNSHRFQLRKNGAGIYLFIYLFILF